MTSFFPTKIRILPGRFHIMSVFISLSMLVTASAFAQVTNATGTIQGTVTDPSGAAIPGAKVTLAEPSTGSSKVITATGSGFYSAGSLVPGLYKITATASGFASTSETLTVQVGVATNGDLKLSVGSAATMVEVQANAVAIDTQQTQIAGVLNREQIANLPLNGRNFLDLAQLQPGVQIQDGTSFDPTKNGFSSISFGGRFGRTARIELDGLDISDENVGTTTQNISEDSIQEFQVAQSNLDITTSITSSGSVNIVSRSGSNTIHGDGLYNFRDKTAGGANFPGGQDNYLQRNNVAGGVGGALLPDKVFYFFSGENTIQHLDAPVSLIGTPLAGLSGSYAAPYKELELLGRFDFNLPHSAHGFLRGALHHNSDVGGFGGGNNFSPYLNENNTPNVGGGLDFLTGNFSHSFRVGYFKFVNHITDATSITDDPTYNKTPGIYLVISPFSSGANYLAPQTTVQSNKQFKYDGSWTKGKHTIRYGAGVNHLLGGGFASFFGIQPQVQLGVAGASDPTNPLTYLVAPAPGFSSAITIGNGQGYDTEIPSFGFPGGGQADYRFTAYAGDQWKITSRINLNYGLRYIRDTGRTDSDLAPVPGVPATTTTPAFSLNDVQPGLANSITQPNKNFGPQAGIAWDVTGQGKTVVRAGAGIYYENNVWNNVLFDRPTRLTQGLFFGDTSACPSTTVSVPTSGGGSTSISTIDGTATGTPIASICGQPLGTIVGGAPVYKDIATLEKTYQSLVAQAGPQGNGAYINNALAEGPNSTGDEPFFPKYKTPQAYQMNIGVQRQVNKNTVVTVDYLRNIGIHFLTAIDQNHVGDVNNYNSTLAAAAVAATVQACGAANVDAAIQACPGLHPASGTSSAGGATLADFAGNGLDSLNGSNSGLPGAKFAFQGKNPNFGQLYFLQPTARSAYNALAITVTQRAQHPLPGIRSTDLTASYTYSHFNGTGTNADTATGPSASGGDQDFGSIALNQRNPNSLFGPNSLDRHQQFSVGLDAEVWKGLRIDTIAHLYSSLPLTLSLPTQGPGDVFVDDVDGDGTVGDVVPGSNVGSFMRKFGPHSINNLINGYNNGDAGKFTPAGTAVVNSGALTSAELTEIGGVQQKLPNAPSDQVGNDILKIWDVGAAYNIKVGDRLTLAPSVHAFNVLNTSNFDGPGGLGLTRISGVLTGSPGSANNTTALSQEPYRVGLGTGVYSFGAPRQIEFGLKFLF
jgi:hypothetical protein